MSRNDFADGSPHIPDLSEAELAAYRASRPSYAELEAIIAQVRHYACMSDPSVGDGFDKQFAAGYATCRRGLRNIPGIGA